MDKVDYVASKLDSISALTALAEEASELSKAALKMARAKGLTKNPTPISESSAENDLIEEFNDVLLCAKVCNKVLDIPLQYNFNNEMEKLDRWIIRLNQLEEM